MSKAADARRELRITVRAIVTCAHVDERILVDRDPRVRAGQLVICMNCGAFKLLMQDNVWQRGKLIKRLEEELKNT